jgi:sugar fermentation stimulation protein A
VSSAALFIFFGHELPNPANIICCYTRPSEDSRKIDCFIPNNPGLREMKKQGAYILYLDVKQPLTLLAGSLKTIFLPEGRYAYVGSALAGIDSRIRRHKRLAEKKAGKCHWHIDYLLAHPLVQLAGETVIAGGSECEISHQIASRKGTTTPVPKFGSTDCRKKCKAHLYHLKATKKCRIKIQPN